MSDCRTFRIYQFDFDKMAARLFSTRMGSEDVMKESISKWNELTNRADFNGQVFFWYESIPSN